MESFRLSQLGLTQQNLSAVLCLAAAAGLLLLLLWVVFSVLRAVGVYRLCENHGIACAWFAFVPVLRAVALGKMADQKSGKKGWSVCYTAVMVLAVLFAASFGFVALCEGTRLLFAADTAVANDAEISFAFSGLFRATAGATAICAALCYLLKTVCIGLIFAQYDAPAAVAVKVILSVIFPFLPAIFLYNMREKHAGFTVKTDLGAWEE